MIYIFMAGLIFVGCSDASTSTTLEDSNQTDIVTTDIVTTDEVTSETLSTDDGNVEVSFDTNGGTLIQSVVVEEGTTLTRPDDPEKDGYEFKGWYTDLSLTQLFDFASVINEDIVLRAKWEKITIKVGVILPDASEYRWALLDGPFFEDILSEIYDESEYDILFSEGNEAVEKANAEALIARGAEVIILMPEGSGRAVLELCEEEGVVLISYDRMANQYGDDSLVPDYYVSFNGWEVGKAQGAHLVQEALDNGCNAENPCDLALFSGRVADWPNATLFFGGAMEEIQPHLDMFNIININPDPIEELGYFTEETFYNDDGTAKNALQSVMQTIDTDWDQQTTEYLAEQIFYVMGDVDKSNEDVYILAPADFLSLIIREVFAESLSNGYRQMYITGQDAMDSTIASLMGDPINGHGIQSMTVFKDVYHLVDYSVQIAVNVLSGVDGLEGLNTGQQVKGVPTAYAPIDVLTYDDPQKTYDLIFASGYKDKNDDIFSNIDFTPYE
jgi:uncharacterized repeat protein (TIGR02543 family)